MQSICEYVCVWQQQITILVYCCYMQINKPIPSNGMQNKTKQKKEKIDKKVALHETSCWKFDGQ